MNRNWREKEGKDMVGSMWIHGRNIDFQAVNFAENQGLHPYGPLYEQIFREIRKQLTRAH